MRRLLTTKIHLPLALAIIAVVSTASAGLIAYRSVRAFGINVGGRINQATPCVLEPIEERCPNCELCSNLLASACGGYTEIIFQPAGGTPGINYICMPNGYLYRGGGTFPRAGGWLNGLLLGQTVPVEVGIGR